jgi:hypothetical protein
MFDKLNGNGQAIDPKAGKPELIENLAPLIPADSRDEIIDKSFNTPKTRYIAHLGILKTDHTFNRPSENDLKRKCEEYSNSHKYNPDKADFETNKKQEIELAQFGDEILAFYYTESTRHLVYDADFRESKPVVGVKKLRILVDMGQKSIDVFTGDRELANNAFSALTNIFGKVAKALSITTAGIQTASLSFHTMKVLDYIYHGLQQIGKIVSITSVDIDSPAKSKKPQKINVKGEDLLEDVNICRYLALEARDLVGLKIDFNINQKGTTSRVQIDLGIFSSRIKLGIRKDVYSIDTIKEFYELLKRNLEENLTVRGLINEKGTEKIITRIRDTAIQSVKI